MNARYIVLATLIAAIAAAAFTLSFQAQLILVTKLADVSPQFAWLYPILVDAFIVTTTLSALWVPQTTKIRAAYPWIAMSLFSAISIGGNALHVLALDVPNRLIAIAIYTVPPIGLLIATHLATTTVFRPRLITTHASRPARKTPPRSQPAAIAPINVERSDIPEPSIEELMAMADDDEMSMQAIADAVGRSKSWVGKKIKDERDRRAVPVEQTVA